MIPREQRDELRREAEAQITAGILKQPMLLDSQLVFDLIAMADRTEAAEARVVQLEKERDAWVMAHEEATRSNATTERKYSEKTTRGF